MKSSEVKLEKRLIISYTAATSLPVICKFRVLSAFSLILVTKHGLLSSINNIDQL